MASVLPSDLPAIGKSSVSDLDTLVFHLRAGTAKDPVHSLPLKRNAN